jgi:hypothetical protein
MKIEKLIFICFFIVCFISASAQEMAYQKVYSVLLEIYKDDTTVLKSISEEEGVISQFLSINTGYEVKVLSKDKELFGGNLPVSFIITMEPGEENGSAVVFEKNVTTVHFRVPSYENADRIEVYHDTSLIFQYKIQRITTTSRTTTTTKPPEPLPRPISIYLIFIGIIIAVIAFFFYRIKVLR